MVQLTMFFPVREIHESLRQKITRKDFALVEAVPNGLIYRICITFTATVPKDSVRMMSRCYCDNLISYMDGFVHGEDNQGDTQVT